jgi:hypothetical protein
MRIEEKNSGVTKKSREKKANRMTLARRVESKTNKIQLK